MNISNIIEKIYNNKLSCKQLYKEFRIVKKMVR